MTTIQFDVINKRFDEMQVQIQELKKPEPKIVTGNDSPIDIKQLLVRYPHLKKGTVYNLTANHKIPHYKRGKQLLFVPSEINDWMANDHTKQLINH